MKRLRTHLASMINFDQDIALTRCGMEVALSRTSDGYDCKSCMQDVNALASLAKKLPFLFKEDFDGRKQAEAILASEGWRFNK